MREVSLGVKQRGFTRPAQFAVGDRALGFWTELLLRLQQPQAHDDQQDGDDDGDGADRVDLRRDAVSQHGPYVHRQRVVVCGQEECDRHLVEGKRQPQQGASQDRGLDVGQGDAPGVQVRN